MAHDVFISYSSKDKNVADAACALLEARGVRCWMAPRDILPGAEWGAAIVGAIGAAKVMVLIYTSSSNASPQVRREVERAVARGLHVIPFRVEDVPMSPALEYFISSPHWLDALTPPLERHLDHLARIITAVLEAQRAGTDGVVAPAPLPAPTASSGWTHGPPPGSFAATAPAPAAPPSGPAPTGGSSAKSKLLIGGGVAALVVAGIVIFAVARSGDDDAKPTAIDVKPSQPVAPDVMPDSPTALPEPSEPVKLPGVAPGVVAPSVVAPAPTTPPPQPPSPPPAAEAGPADVKRFWEMLAQGSPRVPRLQEILDDYPKLANTKNPAGNTPLYEAAKAGQVRVVELLLESGADAKAMSTGGNTPLHGAAEAGITDARLIERLAPGNLDARNADVRTALHVAAALGHAETARLIAEAGAKLEQPDKSGRTALQLAMSAIDPTQAHATALALVNAGAKSDVPDKRGVTPLHVAARAGDAVLVSAMIDKGAKADRAGPVGQTPLHVAANAGSVDVIKALVGRKATVEVIDDQGNTPLHLAAGLKQTAPAEALLAAGAKVATSTPERRTPLHVAAAAGNVAMVELFMRNGGAEVLQRGGPPTPVEVAEKAGKTEVAQLLRRLEFPAMLAAAINAPTKPVPPRLLEMLRKNPKLAGPQGADGRNALHLCAVAGNEKFAAELIKIDPQLVRAFSVAEEQPLHLAAQYKQAAVAKVLLANGAQVRATTRAGDTPLHVAAKAGAADVARALLDAGADPDIENKDHRRAADVAGDAALKAMLVAAEKDASELRSAWSSFELDGRRFSVKGPGLTQPLRIRFFERRNFAAEGDVGGTFKNFTGTYTKGSLTLTLESAEGPMFPGIAGTLYSGKVSVTDDARFTLKAGSAEIAFER